MYLYILYYTVNSRCIEIRGTPGRPEIKVGDIEFYFKGILIEFDITKNQDIDV